MDRIEERLDAMIVATNDLYYWDGVGAVGRLSLTKAIQDHRDDQHKRRDALRDEIADDWRAMVAALEEVEWIGNGYYTTCPWCGHGKEYGHGEDCPRQAALARVKGES